MNKKVIVAGLLVFWTGVAGYMGMRILESYAEDAVQAALSAIPATAEEVKFSFLDKNLSIKGVSYEIPDERIQRKGTIESVEVKGFNRKILYVLPKMAAYAPDELPKVADSVSLKGLSETSHVGYEIMTRKVEHMEIKNWHQRLGLVLDQYSRYGVGEKFFEEVFRCSVEDVTFSNADISIKSDSTSVPLTVRIAQGNTPGGIKAPRLGTFVSPVSFRLKGITFSGDGFHGSLGSLEIRDIMSPEPKYLAQMGDILSSPEPYQEEDFDAITSLFSKAYESYPLFASLGMQGFSLKVEDTPVTLKNLLYTIKYLPEGDTYAVKMQNLHVPADAVKEVASIVQRFSPDGFDLSFEGSSCYGPDTISGSGKYILKGLGEFNVAVDFAGDAKKIQDIAFSGRVDQLMEELSQVEVRSFSMDYEDQGLVPLGFALASMGDEHSFELYQSEIRDTLVEMRMENNTFWTRLANALEEQLRAPGSFHVAFQSAQPVSLQQLAMMLLMDPDRLPVTVTSLPGKKPLAEYPILR